jgi:hypothetical protein
VLCPELHQTGLYHQGSVGGGGGGPGPLWESGSGRSWGGTLENLAEMVAGPDGSHRAGFDPGSCKSC